MIIDSQLLLSDSQALAATALSTNVIDLGAVDRNIGTGEPMVVNVVVEVAATVNDGDEDYTFDIETASDAAITTARKLLGRRVFETAPTAPAENSTLLVAGFIIQIPIPAGGLAEAERYLAVRYTLAGTTPVVTVSTFLSPRDFTQKTVDYPKGYLIS
jgi:hypothetical protein